MNKSNFHTHTTFCDGKDSPEEIVIAAIENGCDYIGFSGHSYTFFDEHYCMSREETEEYKNVIKDLKKKYKDKIKILMGIEQDYYSLESTEDYDYVIGSVHYVYKNGEYFSVDSSYDLQAKCIEKIYDGDCYAFAEDYYKTVADIYNKTKCDIIGHFDLITKFNEKNFMYDITDIRYYNAVKNALNELLKSKALFEINTGAITRGLRTTPYPDDFIKNLILNNGGKFIYSSDCHNKENLLYGIENTDLEKFDFIKRFNNKNKIRRSII